MTSTRKPRSDSVAGQLKLQALMKKPVVPVIELDDRETKIFDEMIASMPRDHWDEHLIRLASRQAKMVVLLEDGVDTLAAEGLVLTDETGRQYRHPMNTVVTQLQNAVKSQMIALGLSASGSNKYRNDAKPKLEGQRMAEAALKAVGGERLLA